MLYTYKSLAIVWLVICAAAAISASAQFTGWGFALLVAVAVAGPAFLLKRLPAAASAHAERMPIVTPGPGVVHARARGPASY
jgi:hypothetical protein